MYINYINSIRTLHPGWRSPVPADRSPTQTENVVEERQVHDYHGSGGCRYPGDSNRYHRVPDKEEELRECVDFVVGRLFRLVTDFVLRVTF